LELQFKKNIMNPDQALQIIKNVSNHCVKRGGIFDTVGEVATVNMALELLEAIISEHKTLLDNAQTPISGDGVST
jgi:hypothetical protein